MNKNKKILILLLCFAFTAAIVFTGCGGQSQQNENGVKKNLRFLSGPTGTTWYAQASAFAGIASNELDYNIDVLTGSAISNVIQLERGEVDMALTFTSYMPAMAEGKVVAEINEEEYFSEPVENSRLLCNTTTAGYVLLASADSPYKTIEDLKGEDIRYVTYPKGFTGRYVPKHILEGHGITHNDIEEAGGRINVVSGYDEAVDLLAKGQADVVAYTMAVDSESAALSELEAQREFKILELSEDGIDNTLEKLPLEVATVPAGLHESIKKDTKVLADVTSWLVHKDMSKEQVKQMMQAMVNNMDRMAEAGNQEFEGFTAKDLSRMVGKGSQISLHPGAKEFFEEKGVLE